MVTLIFDAFTLFMWFKTAPLKCNFTLVTFKFSTNTILCGKQMFLRFFMNALFTFKQSWEGLCGESTWPNNDFFLVQKYKLKRNHQDNITFKHYPNLLATIVCTFILMLSDHTGHIYIGFIHVDSVYGNQIWFCYCFITTLVKFIFDHIMLGFCAFMRAFLSPFITQVTFISTPVCLYLMCNLNACYELP